MLVLKNAARVALLGFVITTQVLAAPTTNETLPGKPLTDLGEFLNKPHVVLAGKIINKVEKEFRSEMTDVAKEICRLHPCTEWSIWNNCSYTFLKGFGYFGRQNRTRNCGFNTTLCKRFSTDQNIEVEFRTCNKCREDYTLTEHGYCIKFVSNKFKTYQGAAHICQADGGNLVNIDSEMKVQDVSTFVKQFKDQYTFWIDGHRATSSSKWEFTRQPEDPSFSRWYPGKPSNQLCLMLKYTGSGSSREYYLYDYSCQNQFPYMCEVF